MGRSVIHVVSFMVDKYLNPAGPSTFLGGQWVRGFAHDFGGLNTLGNAKRSGKSNSHNKTGSCCLCLPCLNV